MSKAYVVSNYMDTIKPVEDFERFKEKTFHWNDFYSGHESYEAAKRYIINRAELKIIKLEDEIRKIKKKLPKLRELSESWPMRRKMKGVAQRSCSKNRTLTQ